jgi:tryptophan-rich sensory protein
MKKILTKGFYLLFPIVTGTLVGVIISSNVDYTILNLPPLAPAKIIFPIVWSIIYLLMGISYLKVKEVKDFSTRDSFIYYLQLFINLMWSFIFFLWKWRGFSVIWILILDIVVIDMIFSFYKKNKVSAYLNIIYIIWILFATYLTIGIWVLN